ncbi:MAG: hypothetical protein GEU28_09140 [Dehalococcoidia bacterium]|nr:hypothetical protein [Dehalococcoidia bacterium]
MEKGYWDKFWARRLSRRSALAVGATGAAAVGFAAVGCGDDDDDDDNGSSDPGPSGSPSGDATQAGGGGQGSDEPTRGGTLITFDNADPPSFDVISSFGYRQSQCSSLAWPTLMRYTESPDRGPLDFNNVEPQLAESLEQPDDTTVVFTLRPNTLFEDREPFNGRELTAEDIVNSWEYYASTSGTRVILAPYVDSVEAVDARTVRFNLNQPSATFVRYMAHHGSFYPVPVELVDAGTSGTDPVGFGPYQLERYDQGVEIEWVKNPNFYGADTIYPDNLIMKIFRDPSTATTAARSKQLHTTTWWNLPEADAADLQASLPDATFVSFPNTFGWYLGMDLRMPEFEDERVRRALSMALDREAMLALYEVGEGRGAYASAIAPQPPWWLDPRDRNAEYGEHGQWFQNDPGEARALLEAAGFGDGLGPYQLFTNQGFGPNHIQTSELVQQQLAEIGISVDIVVQDNAAYYSTTVIGNFEGALANQPGIGQVEPDEALQLEYRGDSGRSAISGREDVLTPENEPQFFDLLTRQQQELDAEVRQELINEIQVYLAGRMYYIPMAVEPITLFHQAELGGVNPLRAYNLSWLYAGSHVRSA